MKLDISTYANKFTAATDPELTSLIKLDAKAAEWPIAIIKTLKVSIKDLKIVAYYPEKYAEEVENLEYGTSNDSPRPVFRRFLVKNEAFVFNKLSSWSVEYLFEQGVLP